MKLPITIDEKKIADFCRTYHIRRQALFGSVIRQDFGPALIVSLEQPSQ